MKSLLIVLCFIITNSVFGQKSQKVSQDFSHNYKHNNTSPAEGVVVEVDSSTENREEALSSSSNYKRLNKSQAKWRHVSSSNHAAQKFAAEGNYKQQFAPRRKRSGPAKVDSKALAQN